MPINADNLARNLNRAVAETTFFAFLLWYLDPAQRDVSNAGYVARMMLIAFLSLVFRGFYNEMAKEETKQPSKAEERQSLRKVTFVLTDPTTETQRTAVKTLINRKLFLSFQERTPSPDSSSESNTEEVPSRAESPTNRV